MKFRKEILMFLIKAGCRRYLMSFAMAIIPFSSIRIFFLRLFGISVGRGCYVGFNVACDTNYPELISIGDNVTISHGCMLITHTQSPARSWLSGIYHFSAPIEIGNGAWLGANSIVLPGVIIASDTMIGAGSVVTTSTGSRELWAGNPCRKVKSLDLGKDKR